MTESEHNDKNCINNCYFALRRISFTDLQEKKTAAITSTVHYQNILYYKACCLWSTSKSFLEKRDIRKVTS